jgi:hypothetical protein
MSGGGQGGGITSALSNLGDDVSLIATWLNTSNKLAEFKTHVQVMLQRQNRIYNY